MASLKAFMASLSGHASRTDNPHAVTHEQAGAIEDAAGTVTDVNIGTRTMTDNAAPTTDTGNLIALLSWLANRVKAITGKASWRTAPAISLETTAIQIQAITGQPSPTISPPASLTDYAFHASADMSTGGAHGITGFGTTAAALGSSQSPGNASTVSRSNHVHPYPTATQVGAMASNHPAAAITGFAGGGSATTVAHSDHGHSGYALTNGSSNETFTAQQFYVGSDGGVQRGSNTALWMSSTNVFLNCSAKTYVSDITRTVYKEIVAAAFTVGSGRSLKKDIEPLNDVTGSMRALQAIRYRYKKGDAKVHAGFIAEDVAAVFPEAVFEIGGEDDVPASLAIDYGKLAVLALQAIKELDVRLDALERQGARA